MDTKTLLIVAHSPSPNTLALADRILAGCKHPDIEVVTTRLLSPFDTGPEDVLSASGIILMTTENLGYMSGALKDFFDRIYYPVLEQQQGLPCAALIRAGHDGTGTKRALETITNGLKWRWVQDPVICRGEWNEQFLEQAEELGLTMAASLDAGII